MTDALQASNRSLCMMLGHQPVSVDVPHGDSYKYCERCGDMIDAPHEADDKHNERKE